MRNFMETTGHQGHATDMCMIYYQKALYKPSIDDYDDMYDDIYDDSYQEAISFSYMGQTHMVFA